MRVLTSPQVTHDEPPVFPFWRPGKHAPESLRDRFFNRYAGACLIVHQGFPSEWLEELMKQPGGAGHFRIDARTPPGRRPTPVEWLVHEHLLALRLPFPLLVVVRDETLYVRHLSRGGQVVHPSEILWMLDEISTRHHAKLTPAADGFAVSQGLDPRDNDVESMYGL